MFVIIYSYVLLRNLGFFHTPIQIVDDSLNVLLLFYSFFYFVNGKRHYKFSAMSKMIMVAWMFFVLYFGILLINEPAYRSKYSAVLNLRDLFPFFMIFYTISVINSYERLIIIVKVLIIFSIVGAFLSIAQSIYGTDPIFKSDIYNLGHWNGQKQTFGSVARVTLPPIYTIQMCFLGLMLYNFVFDKKKYYYIIIILVLPIVLSFTRTYWISLFIVAALSFFLISRNGKNYLNPKNIAKLAFSLILLLPFTLLSQTENELLVNLSHRLEDGYLSLVYGEGTVLSRINTFDAGFNMLRANLFYGLGVYLTNTKGYENFTDIGFIYSLLTIGVIGLTLFSVPLILSLKHAYSFIKKGIFKNDKEKYFFSITIFSSILLFIIEQQLTQYYFVYTLYSFLSGLIIICEGIFKRRETISIW